MTLQPERRRLRAGELISVCKYLMGRKEEKALLIDRTTDNGHKVKHENSVLTPRFFPVRVVKYWNQLPTEAVESPPVEIFKI